MYHLLTAIWNIITHKDDSECFQVSCYWHFTVEAMPQTTSVLPRKGSFLPRAWLTCVLSSKVRESSRKPIQMAPGSLQSCMKLVPRPCHGKSQCILIHTLTLEIPMGLEPDGLCVALFSSLSSAEVGILILPSHVYKEKKNKKKNPQGKKSQLNCLSSCHSWCQSHYVPQGYQFYKSSNFSSLSITCLFSASPLASHVEGISLWDSSWWLGQQEKLLPFWLHITLKC